MTEVQVNAHLDAIIEKQKRNVSQDHAVLKLALHAYSHETIFNGLLTLSYLEDAVTQYTDEIIALGKHSDIYIAGMAAQLFRHIANADNRSAINQILEHTLLACPDDNLVTPSIVAYFDINEIEFIVNRVKEANLINNLARDMRSIFESGLNAVEGGWYSTDQCGITH